MRKSPMIDFEVLCHILEYCEEIEEFIEQFGRDEKIFMSNKAYRAAVSMNLLQIGELTGLLSNDYRSQTRGKINWSEIRGMRNWFAHNYGKMNKHIIWTTATESVPMIVMQK